MANAATSDHSDVGMAGARPAPGRQRRLAVLVTADDTLWPSVGSAVADEVSLTQVDSIDALATEFPVGRSAVVIWDARDDAEGISRLGRLQLHSASLVVMVLDAPAMSSRWERLVDERTIASVVALPFTPATFNEALDRAFEDLAAGSARARTTREPVTRAVASSRRPSPVLLLGAAGAAIVVLAVMGAVLWKARAPTPPFRILRPPDSVSSAPVTEPAVEDDQVDSLLERATQAMLERRYVEPPESSALTLYRSVLEHDAGNDEARQGLSRLAEVLLSKVESALDQRRYDVALQSLEVARSLSRDDPRLPGLDARVFQMRAELGAGAIQATINAGNNDRAVAQIDEATRTKLLTGSQLALLREDLSRRRAADLERATKAAQAKSQQERTAPDARPVLHPENSLKPESLRPGDDATQRPAQLKPGETEKEGAAAAAASPALPAETSLKLLKPLALRYPVAAEAAGTEGWVELQFVVNVDGHAAQVKAVAAAPTGVFERAAVQAMSAARFEAIPKDQPQVLRSGHLRVSFKLSR